MSRTTRSSTRRKKPNAALYVGYVEDDETPDMIMKKFEMMERMHEATRKAKPPPVTGKAGKAEMSDDDEEEEETALTEEQLVTLFNDTSYYSLNSLQKNNDIMFQKQTLDEDGFVVGIDDPNYHQLMFEVDYNPAESDMMYWMEEELSLQSTK